MTDIIIGSGPSGISAAKALLDRGRQVLLLDGGKVLEAKQSAHQSDMAAIAPENWNNDQRAAYQEPNFNAPDGQARRYGSDFAMEPKDTILGFGSDDFALRSSRAAGGLSNLWGAAVLPYRQADIQNWPVTIDDLAPHYRAVAEFMPVAGRNDRLNDIFPGFAISEDTAPAPSVQAAEILKQLDRKPTSGIHFGAARNAVQQGCFACGMCLHGCPWGLIYSAGHTLAHLIASPNFTYQSGAIVVAFEETATGVLVRLKSGDTVTGTRLFIGAGVLETARIALNSMPETNQTLTMLDSQHSLVPLLHHWRTDRRPDAMPLTTLPQVFLEMDLPELSPHLVHSQIYTWNENFARDLITNYGFGLGFTSPLLRALARRLIVAQVFLHSDHSARVALALGGDGKLTTGIQKNPKTEIILKAAQKQLGRSLSKAGLHMLGFAARPGTVGSSFHVGGTLPMATTPQGHQTDPLGRPNGLQRVHVVDASVFPSIPATTITFSVMANAHRIASLVPA